MTEFRALNSYAKATGESLQEKVDLAMPDSVLDMRFAHFLGDFVDDEGFLNATYQAAIQVEKKKALKTAQEATRGPSSGGKDPKKDKGKEKQTRNPARPKQALEPEKTPAGKRRAWVSLETALQGVPPKEQEEYKATDSCWRCGRPGHKTFECYAFTTARGTSLPAAPWKAAAVGSNQKGGKRKAANELDERLVKQQKVAAVEPMAIEEAEPPRKIEAAPWDDSDSDF